MGLYHLYLVLDFVGYYLVLALQAAKTPHKTILFCGVHFMAETAAIISPEKKVLIPDTNAGCSLSDSINLEQLKKWKSEHPNAIAVGYVFKFANNAPDGANALTISPNASDGINYAGTSVDDKDLINTKATSKQGDFVVIASLDGTTAWQVTQVRGTFAKES